jgi:hypothetical protein
VSEIRVDPLSGLRSIIAPDRAERFAEQGDPFAEGNESQTPPELYAVRPGAKRSRHARLAGPRVRESLPGARRGGPGGGA